MSMSLSLKGIPLSGIHRITEHDTTTKNYSFAMNSFEKRKNGSTGLLEVPAVKKVNTLADYIVEYITKALINNFESDIRFEPTTVDDVNTATELHFMLASTIAERLDSIDSEEVPIVDNTVFPIIPEKYTIDQDPTMDELILLSILRTDVVLPELSDQRVNGNSIPIADPVLRLATESAALRQRNPFYSERETKIVKEKVDRLEVAKQSLKKPFDDVPPRKVKPLLDRDFTIVKDTLVNTLNNPMEIIQPDDSEIALDILKRYAEAKRDVQPFKPVDVFYITAGRTLEVLREINVLRNISYE